MTHDCYIEDKPPHLRARNDVDGIDCHALYHPLHEVLDAMGLIFHGAMIERKRESKQEEEVSPFLPPSPPMTLSYILPLYSPSPPKGSPSPNTA